MMMPVPKYSIYGANDAKLTLRSAILTLADVVEHEHEHQPAASPASSPLPPQHQRLHQVNHHHHNYEIPPPTPCREYSVHCDFSSSNDEYYYGHRSAKRQCISLDSHNDCSYYYSNNDNYWYDNDDDCATSYMSSLLSLHHQRRTTTKRVHFAPHLAAVIIDDHAAVTSATTWYEAEEYAAFQADARATIQAVRQRATMLKEYTTRADHGNCHEQQQQQPQYCVLGLEQFVSPKRERQRQMRVRDHVRSTLLQINNNKTKQKQQRYLRRSCLLPHNSMEAIGYVITADHQEWVR